MMRSVNPVVIPRNHRLEGVIAAGKERDFALFHQLREILQSPYEDRPEAVAFETPPQPSEEVRATFCGT
jgi:uncharacterized protein YdiU (UPF0061 family)